MTGRQLSGKWLQYALSFGHQSSLTCRGRIAFGAEPCSGAWRFLSTESSNVSRRGTMHHGAGGWPLLLTDQMAGELPQSWARLAAWPEGGRLHLRHLSESGWREGTLGSVCVGSCLPCNIRNSLTSWGCWKERESDSSRERGEGQEH